MFSTVNPDKVGFSKGSRVSIGAVGAGKGTLTPVGLLGADITLGMEKTYRTKMDHFPEVEVASAVQTLNLTVNLVLREWTKQNLMYALDVAVGDVTDAAGTPVNITDEPHKLDANGVATLLNAGASAIVVTKGATSAVLGTDYVIATVGGWQRVIALTGSSVLAPSDDILVDYTYTPAASTSMPLGHSGARNYYQVLLEEESTLSATAKTEYLIHRAAIGLDGNFNLNSAENGIDLPVIIQASLAAGQTVLGTLTNYA